MSDNSKLIEDVMDIVRPSALTMPDVKEALTLLAQKKDEETNQRIISLIKEDKKGFIKKLQEQVRSQTAQEIFKAIGQMLIKHDDCIRCEDLPKQYGKLKSNFLKGDVKNGN